MNVALPAFIIFLLLLPGFVFRAHLKRAERTSLDYSPFGEIAAEAILWALLAHLAWLSFAFFFFHRTFDPEVLLRLLASDAIGQARATSAVAQNFGWISTYFVTLLFASYAAPKIVRHLVSKYRLDRDSAPFSAVFRFHHAPWYYLLTGADFEAEAAPDFIVLSAIVEVAGEAILYTGLLDEFFVNSDGGLDRLVLQSVMRRPIAADKVPTKPEEWHDSSRFYPIEGDYFVLRYSEAITLNVRYVKLTEAAH